MIPVALGPHTIEDWHTTPEERLELIEGHFRELPLHTGQHGVIRSELRELFRQTRRYVVTGAGFEVSEEWRTALMPDLVVLNCWSSHDYPVPEQVDLVGEVWSPEDTPEDRRHRQLIYARAGIRYFWGIEQDGPVVTAYERREGEYHERITLRPGAVGTITAAPVSVSFDPADLFPW